MFCFPLTKWITMRGSAGTNVAVTQSESQWLDLQRFEDVVAWMQCQEVTASGATIQLNYQTAPTKDETLFTSLATVNLAASSAPVVTKVIMSSVSVPLSRWLRWQLLASGTATAAWDATFRIWIAANIGPHQLRPKTQPHPLRPSGKTCSGDCTKGGSTPAAGRPAMVASHMTPQMTRRLPNTALSGGGPTFVGGAVPK